MMSLIAWAAGMGGALAAARLEGGGVTRYGLGTSIGFGLGGLALMALRRAGEAVFRTLPRDGASEKAPLRLKLIYLVSFVWPLPSTMLGLWVTQGLLRFMDT
ncbi:hypothetical protein LY474_28585 [Myxococcus stipitatus]|uniref:hypothetical protein n=1 Tax=Myxococcus stipitatus TaxID=83455 RepID=UPI001F33B0A5|nr:hypothetical protein [Myxococcus stipitatus]MCE9671772.1 hypothetical protein [Myxococcus stipitatus]